MVDSEAQISQRTGSSPRKRISKRDLLTMGGPAAAGVLLACVKIVPAVQEYNKKRAEFLPMLQEPSRTPLRPENQQPYKDSDYYSFFGRIIKHMDRWGNPEQRRLLTALFDRAYGETMSQGYANFNYENCRERTGTQRTKVLKNGNTFIYITACIQKPLNIDNGLSNFLEIKVCDSSLVAPADNIRRIIFCDDQRYLLGGTTGCMDFRELEKDINTGGAVDIAGSTNVPSLNTNHLQAIREVLDEAKFDEIATGSVRKYFAREWGTPDMPINPIRGIQQA